MQEPGQGVSKYVIGLLIFAGLITGTMAFRQMLHEARAISSVADLPVLGRLPDFTLTRETSQPLSLSDLRDKVWVADFIFTRCAGPCPRMTRRMADLQDQLADVPNARLVTYTVDPEYDTPEVLQQYAKMFGADPDRWLFVTGDRRSIYDLSINGFKMAVGESPDDEHFLLHSTRFVLIDGQGNIRGYYDESEPEQMARLIADVRTLAAGPAL